MIRQFPCRHMKPTVLRGPISVRTFRQIKPWGEPCRQGNARLCRQALRLQFLKASKCKSDQGPGISLVNSPGTIDSDYRGPLGIILINHGQDAVHISHGDRVAQIVIAPISQARFSVVDELSETERGHGGFGSTGTD